MEVDFFKSSAVPSRHAREFRWHVLGRSLVAAVLALAALLAYHFQYVSTPKSLLGVCGLILTYDALFYFMPWCARKPEPATMVCLVLDLFALTSYLHFSGDIENPLTLAYSLPVVAGAVILSRRAGFVLAGLAGFLFITLVLMTMLDAFPIRVDHHHLALVGDLILHDRIDPDLNQQGWNYILVDLTVLIAVLFGSAHGFGTLSQRLRGENERLLLLLSILPEGVVLLGKEGMILHANPAAHLLLNGSVGRSIRDLDPSSGLADRFARFKGPVDEFETVHRDRIFDHALARKSPAGPVVWVFKDTTEQRRLMAQIMHRSKMIDLGLLAAGVAHEIGNPLSSMSAILQVMEMKGPAPELAGRIRTLTSHVDRIDGIVQDITGFARPSSGKRSPADVLVLLEKALQIFRLHDKSKNVRVESPPVATPVGILAVEDQIVQILLNLLLNAADACGERGTVTISVRPSEREVRISIVDDGAGMSEETRSHLFTPFFTTKEPGKGVGLGLFISESIARAHGGRVEAQSSIGKGSVFTLCLPIQTVG